MKKFAFLLTVFAALFLMSCDSETPITPSDVSNIRSEARPGAIFLQWDRPADLNFDNLWIRWFDPLTQTERFHVASIYGDTLLIPNTLQRLGEYRFSFQTESSTRTKGTMQHFTAVSGRHPYTLIFNDPVRVPLTAEQLYSPHTHIGDGALEHLLTDPVNEHFHTNWGGAFPAPHWFQIDLGADGIIEDGWFRFWWRNRATGAGHPTDIDLMGSMDGNEWFLLRNITQDTDNINVANAGEWTSNNTIVREPFRHLRFSVNATNTANPAPWFVSSGFRLYTGTITIIDPENPN